MALLRYTLLHSLFLQSHFDPPTSALRLCLRDRSVGPRMSSGRGLPRCLLNLISNIREPPFHPAAHTPPRPWREGARSSLLAPRRPLASSLQTSVIRVPLCARYLALSPIHEAQIPLPARDAARLSLARRHIHQWRVAQPGRRSSTSRRLLLLAVRRQERVCGTAGGGASQEPAGSLHTQKTWPALWGCPDLASRPGGGLRRVWKAGQAGRGGRSVCWLSGNTCVSGRTFTLHPGTKSCL